MRLAALAAFVAALFTSSPGQANSYRDTSKPMGVVTNLDLDRYAGKWFEIARFPNRWERGCEGVTAEYGRNADGTISVRNTCRKGSPTGPAEVAEATAKVVGPGKLTVNFVPWLPFAKGDYWVLYVDAAYSVAVVGEPSGKTGWILARTPALSQAKYDKAISVMQGMGYDTSQLRRVVH
ncbi:lipocalin family protein [Sinisalibacter lacisalsi]|uniref:Outer membrane lipoprotein Blc n=1 Tax=Sinisalibacter lacisalsi TaxID=1526570 RepID=A0ABQ1QVA2_9RHOB|nr:lipocalin family protein [Sinisalibacter lacisalsi]GGD43108.1 membrane protein [Sinisalibacter lacisalsi]